MGGGPAVGCQVDMNHDRYCENAKKKSGGGFCRGKGVSVDVNEELKVL